MLDLKDQSVADAADEFRDEFPGLWPVADGGVSVPGELYDVDVDADPAELDNLFDDETHLAVRADLLHQLSRWQSRLTDDLPNGNYLPLRRAHNWRWAATQPPPATNHPRPQAGSAALVG